MAEAIARRRLALGTAVALAGLVLAGVGVVILRGAMANYPYQDLVTRQLSWFAVGVVVAVLVSISPSAWLKRAAYPLAGLMAASLLLLLHSAQHTWLRPTDLIIVGAIPALARYRASAQAPPSWAAWFSVSLLVLVGGLSLLVAGPAPALIGLFVAFGALSVQRWTAPQKVATGLALALAVGITLASLRGYQIARLNAWLFPGDQPRGAGWRVLEQRRLLGEGGWWGAEAAWPHRHGVNAFEAPYVFLGHEHGWLAVLGVLLLNLVVVVVASWIGFKTASAESRAIGRGVAAFWGAHLALAAGGNLGLLPELANTPPLLGYGGSAVVAALLSLGLSVHVLRRGEVVTPDAPVEGGSEP